MAAIAPANGELEPSTRMGPAHLWVTALLRAGGVLSAQDETRRRRNARSGRNSSDFASELGTCSTLNEAANANVPQTTDSKYMKYGRHTNHRWLQLSLATLFFVLAGVARRLGLTNGRPASNTSLVLFSYFRLILVLLLYSLHLGSLIPLSLTTVSSCSYFLFKILICL